MGCLNITPLVLSDTFNTWFERTNELITGINSFYIRGLSASNRSGTDIEAFVIQEDQDCFYTIDLKTGPFLGFITSSEDGYNSAIHGTGDYVNPYTSKFLSNRLNKCIGIDIGRPFVTRRGTNIEIVHKNNIRSKRLFKCKFVKE